jgi:hypothetical protein
MIARPALTVSLLALMLLAGRAVANVMPEHELWSIEQQRCTPGFERFRWVKMSNGQLSVWYGRHLMRACPAGEWTIYTYSNTERAESAGVKCRELPGRSVEVQWARAVKLSTAEHAA